MSLRNLVLVYTKACVDPSDFEEIARNIKARSSDIEVAVLEDETLPLPLILQAAARPSLIFSPLVLRKFIPVRGRILCGRRIPKPIQMKLMAAQGIAVPDWQLITPESRFRPDEWGEVAVVKPGGYMLASYARGVELTLTEAITYCPPETFAEDHPGRYGPMMIQRFIDTGLYPSKIRVLTLFGVPLYGEEIRSELPQTLPQDPTVESLKAIQITVVNGPRTRRFVYDEDVMTLARKIYRAAPFIPLQGCDFVRHAETGKLYALEFNPGGNTWHFSSKESGHHRIEGKRRQEQFDAFSVAADVLITETRRRAL